MTAIEPSERQIHYASDIARTLGIPMPQNGTMTDYAKFIASHLDEYHSARRKPKPESAPSKPKKNDKYLIQEVEPRLRLQNIKQRISEEPLLTPEAVIRFAQNYTKGWAAESILVFNLDVKGLVINFCRVSIGTINQSLTSGREIFKSAVLSNAAGIIMIHNHLTNDPKPSPDDINITTTIAQCGHILGIPLLDHIIVAGKQFYSFNESNADLFGACGMIAERREHE